MRKSADKKAAERIAATVAVAALACIGAVALLLFIFGAAAVKMDFSDGALSVMSGIALSAGCFTAAYIVSSRRRKKGLVTGLFCGAVVFAVIFLMSIIFVRSFSAGGFISKLLIILSCSGIGGIIGVNSKRRFR